MKMMGALVLAASLAACATKPISETQARSAPPDRIYGHQAPVQGGGTVVLVRDAGFSGSACPLAVLVNGETAATLEQGEKVQLNLPAGEIILGVMQAGSKLCRVGEDRRRREISATIAGGSNKKYRIGLTGSGELSIEPTAY